MSFTYFDQTLSFSLSFFPSHSLSLPLIFFSFSLSHSPSISVYIVTATKRRREEKCGHRLRSYISNNEHSREEGVGQVSSTSFHSSLLCHIIFPFSFSLSFLHLLCILSIFSPSLLPVISSYDLLSYNSISCDVMSHYFILQYIILYNLILYHILL